MPMSQGFHQGVFNFSNEYERSTNMKQQSGDHWINQRDILKVQGFELQQQVQVEVSGVPQVYDTGGGGGMLAEMIDNFPRGRKVVNNHILDGQIQSSYRWSQKQPLAVVAVNEAGLPQMNQHNIKASSSSPTCSSLLHLSVLPNSLDSHQHLQQGYQLDNPSQFSWIRGGSSNEVDDHLCTKIGRTIEGQGLSLSLSSPLPNLEASKFQELRIGDGGMFFFDQGVGGVGPSMSLYGFKNHQESNQQTTGICTTDYSTGHHQVHVGHPASSRIGNLLRNSRYLRAAQELLEEFCCVGRGQFKSPMAVKGQNGNPRSISIGDGVGGPAVSSSSSKDRAPLSAAGKNEYQRKKIKLLSMLDEVDARYTHYCEQMQAIVGSFDSVIGYGAAAPYTNLAQKAMSRHFRSIKDAIVAQVKVTCEVLGDKEVAGTIGLTKGETPRLKVLEQKFRQQKALHQLGMLDPETWRPQRGLPERSVHILRAWLFEHFLHPYPSDADKHLLSRQTGLSKNQVSNWFINARVRLWKPMVEDIYKEETKDEDEQEQTTANELAKSDDSEDHQSQSQSQNQSQIQSQNQNINIIGSAQTPMHNKTTSTSKATISSSSTTVTLGEGLRRSEINAAEKDPSRNTINYGQYYALGNQAILQGTPTTTTTTTTPSMISTTSAAHDDDDHHHQTLPTYACFMTNISSPPPEQAAVGMHGGRSGLTLPEFGNSNNNNITSSLVGIGTQAAGDVSLTLGLRHSTNVPRKSSEFSIRDFGAF